MFKQLRRKFIVVAMCSVIAVLSAVIGIINVVNYINVVDNADMLISILKDGGGSFGGVHGKPISPETPYETRYFTVLLGGDGKAVWVNDDEIAAVSAHQAAAYAEELYSKNKTGGFYGQYRYGITKTPLGTMYIFVDCTRSFSSFYNFLLASIAVGVASVALVFILVCVFSGRAMKPVSESYEKQKRFITDAGHEIKTPLTIIGADVDVLEMQKGTNEWTQNIKEQVKRMNSLTEKLVFLARMEEDGKALKATDFSISDAVRESVQPFYAVALSRGITLKENIKPNLTYCGDESMIRRLVSLLCDNALKYSDGDEVVVELASSGNKISLAVTNRASYMQDGNLDLLFERFYRSDGSRNSETGGHGIGLSVAQAIVSAHKGKISARKEGENIIFTVTL